MVSELPRQRLVFIVDEEYMLASTLAQFLRLEGFDVRSLAAPVEALGAAHLSPPDLLIADVDLSPFRASNLRRVCEKSVRTARCYCFLVLPTPIASFKSPLLLDMTLHFSRARSVCSTLWKEFRA